MPEPSRYPFALLVVMLLASACSVEPTTTAGDPRQISSDCLQPPWYPQRPPAGVQAMMCSGERNYRFVLGTGEPLSNAAGQRFLNAHRAELHAIEGITGSGFGLCCLGFDGSEPQCVALTLRLCSTPLPELIDKLREMQADDEHVATGALRVSVMLEGLTGPRCERDDSDCGPLPYESNHVGTAPQNRTLIRKSHFDSQTCDYDGECIKNGCGNECDHWMFGEMIGTCQGELGLSDAFCGCVDGQCSWFH